MQDLVAELGRITGHDFSDQKLGLQALTHSSYAKTFHTPFRDNERLEYLGDAVLELIVSNYLYLSFPKMSEGEMTRCRSWLVREDSLYAAAVRIRLDSLIRLDEGEEKIGGRQKPSIVSDAFEAVIAAIYLDGGYEESEKFVKMALLDAVPYEDILPKKDYKTLLQEHYQSKLKNPVIRYELLETSGPDHKKVFKMAVLLNGEVLAEGTGNSKQSAGEKAAEAALAKAEK